MPDEGRLAFAGVLEETLSAADLFAVAGLVNGKKLIKIVIAASALFKEPFARAHASCTAAVGAFSIGRRGSRKAGQ